MTAKEYLSQVSDIKTGLEAMSEQLIFLKSAAEYVTPKLSGMPRPASPNLRSGEDAIIRVMELESSIKAQYEKLAEISDTVSKLRDPRHRTVLVKYYLSGKTWREVEIETHCYKRTVRSIHLAALEEVDKILKS
jgi:hypothetical protein